MALRDVTDWISEFGTPGHIWYAKRLSANDTLANNTHQAGPYIPKDFLFSIFPALNRPDIQNPDINFDLRIDSHPDERRVRAIWYNNRLHGGTRNETRVTGFGGSSSALLDPESTGALAIFAFVLDTTGSATSCRVWGCRNSTEEDLFEERIGPVEPKKFTIWRASEAPVPAAPQSAPATGSCRLQPAEVPPAWLLKFPSGEEIIRKVLERRPQARLAPDDRLIKRRDCEFEMFLGLEEAFYLPRISVGFTGLDGFLGLAQTILQSRKSRSGKSLELQVREIFLEEGLRPDIDFAHGPIIEGGKRPDFLFPSVTAYNDPAYPADRLRMLASKTTCKDRWRQVLNEASRIPIKHLVTLQEGVSVNQFREMQEAGVRLVVPASLHSSYPEAIRGQLTSLSGFISGLAGTGT